MKSMRRKQGKLSSQWCCDQKIGFCHVDLGMVEPLAIRRPRTRAVKARCWSVGRCRSVRVRLSSIATAPASLMPAFIACA